MARMLVIDDDKLTCDALVELVRTIGHTADFALTGAEGKRMAQATEYDVIFLDVRLPDTNGLVILPDLRQGTPPPEVIMLTGLGDPDGAELAIRNGAWDYLQKPLSPKKILLPLQRVLKYRDSLRECSAPPLLLSRADIIGHSPALERALEHLASAARGDGSVLIHGETGTGKELFAKALHRNSRRKSGPFVVVDCASIPATLLESTLFGHVKGAFTGADRASDGLVLGANNGTLFLDEIGELPLELQKKLLRVLQERRYRPVGGSIEVESDFRLVAATNRNLEQMVEDGDFRRDLLYRLGATTLHLPPLRERKEDFPELVESMVRRMARQYGVPEKKLSTGFLETLESYDWPGNVRELDNVIESAFTGAFDLPELCVHNLPEGMRIRILKHSIELNGERNGAAAAHPALSASGNLHTPPSSVGSYKDFRQQVLAVAEREYFSQLMETSAWDIRRACEISGLGKSRLYAQLKHYGLEKD